MKSIMKSSAAAYKASNSELGQFNLPSYKLDGAKLLVNRL